MENKKKYNGWFVTAMATTGVAILAVVAALVVGIGFGVKNANLQANINHNAQVIESQSDKLDKQDKVIDGQSQLIGICRNSAAGLAGAATGLEDAFATLRQSFIDLDADAATSAMQKYQSAENLATDQVIEDTNTCLATD